MCPKSQFPQSSHRRIIADISVELESEPVSTVSFPCWSGVQFNIRVVVVHLSIGGGVCITVDHMGECEEATHEL